MPAGPAPPARSPRRLAFRLRACAAANTPRCARCGTATGRTAPASSSLPQVLIRLQENLLAQVQGVLAVADQPQQVIEDPLFPTGDQEVVGLHARRGAPARSGRGPQPPERSTLRLLSKDARGMKKVERALRDYYRARRISVTGYEIQGSAVHGMLHPTSAHRGDRRRRRHPLYPFLMGELSRIGVAIDSGPARAVRRV